MVGQVTTVKVCDTIHYEIVSGDSNNHFFIDDSGRIFTNASLNFEDINFYKLEIGALSKDANGDFTVIATPQNTTVNIFIVDENEAPYWNLTTLDVHFCFDPLPGDFIYQLSAIDDDVDRRINYVYDSVVSPFDINTTTGEIFKGTEGYSFFPNNQAIISAYVVDTVNSALRSGSLFINITWCSLEAPAFYSPLNRNLIICENDLSYELQLQVNDTNAHFYIVDGNVGGKFNLSSSGMLSMSESLDRESEPTYQLVIGAKGLRGNGINAVANLTLSIQTCDLNDNQPQFHNVPSNITLYANTVYYNATIFILNATDQDLFENGTIHQYTWSLPLDLPTQISFNEKYIKVDGFLGMNLTSHSYAVNISVCDAGLSPKCFTDNITFSEFRGS